MPLSPLPRAGLKRCRDAVVRERRTQVDPESGDAAPFTSLAERYLEASPEAAELFAIWDTLGKVRKREG
jgi:transposase